MPKHSVEEIDKLLSQCLDVHLPVPPSTDVNVALRVADCMESKGFSFELKDMAPKSLYDSSWQATFSDGEKECVAEDSQPAVAICIAAADALVG